jgi:hypothetical protein
MQSWKILPIYQTEEPLNLGPLLIYYFIGCSRRDIINLLFGLPAEKYTVQQLLND